MQPSEQQPQPQATPVEAGDETFEQQEMPALYEFAPEFQSQTDTAAPQPEAAPTADAQQLEEAPLLDPRALEEAVRQGRIYPPPPSYYENLLFQSPNEPAGFSAITMHNTYPAPPSYPPQPAYQPPRPVTQAARPRRPRVWVWIVVVALGVGLVGCGLLGWGAYSIVSTAYQSASGSIQVVEDFYSNLQSQDYQAAYKDLDMPNLTLAQFTQQAQQADREGTIQSYQLQQPSIGVSQNAPDLTHLSYSVNITRTHASYTALIDVSQQGNTWKITNFDRL